MANLAAATPTLRERLLGKIVNAGPATPCATWVGAYNRPGKTSVKGRRVHRRPVIRLGVVGSPIVYVLPLLLQLSGEEPTEERRQAGHTCPTRCDGVYSCVDLAHARWVSQRENERDKRK